MFVLVNLFNKHIIMQNIIIYVMDVEMYLKVIILIINLIELIMAFGVFVGGILCIILVLMVFRMFYIKNPVLKDLTIIYCSSIIVLYFVSGNFLTNVNLFIFVALCFSEKIKVYKV